jgi:hypothetical protein
MQRGITPTGLIWIASLFGLIASRAASAEEPPTLEAGRTSTASAAIPDAYVDPKVQAEPESDDSSDAEVPAKRLESSQAPVYRNPQKSINLGLIAGAAVGGGQAQFVIGANVGYAVLTGVVPGVRAVMIAGNGVAGELGLTVTLTPPITTSFTPFAIGEVGRRFDDLGGWIYGAGGGLYLGEPAAQFAFQLGWMFRRIVYSDHGVDASGPIVAFSARF